MAGGYANDDSYEGLSKHIQSTKKETNNILNKTINVTPISKYVKKSSGGIPETLCGCQQKCTSRVSPTLIEKVYTHFKNLQNREREYDYLATLILIKVRQISDDKKSNKGNKGTVRKMSFRYFIPVLTDDDLAPQTQKRKLLEQLQANSECKITFPAKLFPDWDHVEVCLSAFITVHNISEKRVFLTRNTRKLQVEMKCTKPFNMYMNSIMTTNKQSTVEPMKKKIKLQDSPTIETKKKNMIDSGAEMSRLAAEWLAQQIEEQKSPYKINPNTMLPEGLILPASVICLPIFSKGNNNNETNGGSNGISEQMIDYSHDLDIVDSFFSDQLWKPEYIGGVP